MDTNILIAFIIDFSIVACSLFNGIYVYYSNRGSMVNRAFSLLMLLIAVWIGYRSLLLFITDPVLIEWGDRVQISFNIWVVSAALYFALVFNQKKDVSLLLKLPLVIVPVVFDFSFLFTKLMFVNMYFPTRISRLYSKWTLGPLFKYYTFWVFFSIFLLIAIFAYNFIKRKGIERKQVGLILFAFGLFSVCAISFNLLRMVLNWPVATRMIGYVAMIPAQLLIAYAIVKYNLFKITPTVAAQEILASLGDTALVCDLNGNPIYNPSGNTAFQNNQDIMKITDQVVRDGDLHDQKISIQSKNLVVSAFLFTQAGGGVLIILHDVTDMEKAIEQEAVINKSLSDKLFNEKAFHDTLIKIASASDISTINDIARTNLQGLGPERAALMPEVVKIAEHNLKLLKKTAHCENRLDELNGQESEIMKNIEEIDNKIKELLQ
ncbi:MAG: histidine kinase N-terminal 7TM domain-containing protein [Candidatus Margulisiibacteriota bacterium]|nr:hypothetical protein [Candidatus Margulisiibacteriota bacterium]